LDSNLRITALLEFLRDDPKDASAIYMLALEYINSGKDSEAAGWMEQLTKHHENYLPNYYHYGKLLERQNNSEAAVLIYEKGILIAKKQNDSHTLNEIKSALDALE